MYWWNWCNGTNYIEGTVSTDIAMKAEVKKSIQKNKIKLANQHKLNRRLPSFKCRAQLK